MFTLGGLRIGDDLRLTIRGETVQLRPDEGLRVVERLLRVSTRKMMVEEADAAAADLAKTENPGRALPGVRSAGTKPASGSRRG